MRAEVGLFALFPTNEHRARYGDTQKDVHLPRQACSTSECVLKDLYHHLCHSRFSFSRSLLILDDVWSAEVVKTFNVSGRVLITTQDVSVVDVIPQSQRTVVEVSEERQQEKIANSLARSGHP